MPGMNENNARIIKHDAMPAIQVSTARSVPDKHEVWRTIVLAKLAPKLLQPFFIIYSLLHHFICFTEALFAVPVVKIRPFELQLPKQEGYPNSRPVNALSKGVT